MLYKYFAFRKFIQEYNFCVMCFGTTQQADEKVRAALMHSEKHLFNLNRHDESQIRFKNLGVAGLKSSDLTKDAWKALTNELHERQKSCRGVLPDDRTIVYWPESV